MSVLPLSNPHRFFNLRGFHFFSFYANQTNINSRLAPNHFRHREGTLVPVAIQTLATDRCSLTKKIAPIVGAIKISRLQLQIKPYLH